jgi:hypothetical protein
VWQIAKVELRTVLKSLCLHFFITMNFNNMTMSELLGQTAGSILGLHPMQLETEIKSPLYVVKPSGSDFKRRKAYRFSLVRGPMLSFIAFKKNSKTSLFLHCLCARTTS